MTIIGIDHGNAAIKTCGFCFSSGVVAYDNEPYTKSNVLEFGGKYYVCGSGRQPLMHDKTADDSYYILTLAAIAKELKARNLPAKADVTLAVGLPLASFGRQKQRFRQYLLRGGGPVHFRFEGTPYEIGIERLHVFPQGYAAVLMHRDLIGREPSVIVADIGGWTVDVMRLDNSIPDASTCRSLELGVIRCIDEASEQVRRSLGLSLTSVQIESVLNGNDNSVDDRAKVIIADVGRRYTQSVLAAVSESGLDVRAIPTVFMGGGANIIAKNLSSSDKLCRPVIMGDVHANAAGYEALAAQIDGLTDA